MIVAGFGFRASATADSLRSALDLATGGQDVTALAAPADKCAAHAFRAFCTSMDLPVLPVSPDALQAVETLTRSARVEAERGTGSVAEAAAMAAVIAAQGPGARLLGPRQISSDRLASCAVATGQTP